MSSREEGVNEGQDMNSSWRIIRVLGRVSAIATALLVVGCDERGRIGGGGVSGEAAITADHVVQSGQACAPAGKHPEHTGFACVTCHLCAGTVSFDPARAGSTAAFD